MRILIIGKVDSQISEASKIAKNHGAAVTHAPDVDSAIKLLLSGKGADLILIDVRLDIADLVTKLQAEHIFVEVVGYGIDASSEDAVKAIKAGAKEYIPFPPDEALIAAVLEAISDDKVTFIHGSKAMNEIVTMADRVANSDASVLITGESGTGKEVIARYIHQQSNRASKPFISVNCAAIPDNLLESELFGHEKGAFTGANNRRIGKFEEANHGTLLLDEISEMDLRLQAKLLRAIQEREIDRVGGSQPVKLDIRILATSNRNLKEEVKNGNFREDLLFRINVIELKLPPLRERKEDLTLFADHFIKKYAEANGIPVKPLSNDAANKLAQYHWPGNVRELENTLHRAVLLSSGEEIDAGALQLQDGQDGTDASSEQANEGHGNLAIDDFVGKKVEDVERELILKTLDHCLGNRTHAANILGISIRTLRNKLKQYNQ